MNPYDFNPYSPFSADVIYSRGAYSCYEPEKIVASQLGGHVSSLPDQLYHHTYVQPRQYQQRQYFASAPASFPSQNSASEPDPIEMDEDFFEWFVKSNDFYVLLLFILLVLVINFIVIITRIPSFEMSQPSINS